MLKNTQPAPERDLVTGDAATPAERLASFRSFVRRQLPIIVFVALLTNALGIVYVLTTPPSYTAQALMIIDTGRPQMFQQQGSGEPVVDSGLVESQVEILKSEKISLAVIEKLHLAEDPEFVGRGSGLLRTLTGFISGFCGSSEPKSEVQLTRCAAEVFAGRLTVRRIGLTYVIQISFRSLNPDRAAQIANAVADAYLTDQLEAKLQATRSAGAWLQDRIRDLRAQASTAQRAVVEFKAKNNIVDTGTKGQLMDEQLAEINSQLVIARTRTSEARARLDRIEAVLRADAPDVTADATVADSLKNDVIIKLRSQYFALADQVADLSARYGKDHLAVVHLRNQMGEVRNSIVDELRRIAETYKSDYEIAKQDEESVQKELAHAVLQSQVTNKAQVALRELESNAETYRSLYDNFLQRYTESVQQQSFPITEARVVMAASPPTEKSHPKTFAILAGAGMAGFMLGLGIAWLRDLSNRVFRTAAEVEASLQLDCVAVLPHISSGDTKGSWLGGRSRTVIKNAVAPIANDCGTKRNSVGRNENDSLIGARTIVRDHELFWCVIDSPSSRFTESMRSIKMAADLSVAGKSNKVIGITSALPNEGKSTVAASLAQLMSHTGARTILVDCDLRRPLLTRLLTPAANSGFVDIFSGKTVFEDVIWIDPSTGLTFLPAFMSSRLTHPNEFLASDAMHKLFDRLRENYDYVVVDLSPLAPFVDARATTHFIDSYFLVIEWGHTKFDAVEKALNDARSVYDNVLGVVLNKANIRVLSRYDGYRRYDNKYYFRYGYTE
jgi:polysaccharide biosynthesis transport protein